MTTKNSYRSHVVEDAIAQVLAGKGITDESVAEDVMIALEELRIVSYQRSDVLPLLSVAGRVLVLIMERPDMTMREMAVRLGTADTNVSRAVSKLARFNLVTRHRVGRRNNYRVNREEVLAHPDIWRLLAAVDGVMT